MRRGQLNAGEREGEQYYRADFHRFVISFTVCCHLHDERAPEKKDIPFKIFLRSEANRRRLFSRIVLGQNLQSFTGIKGLTPRSRPM
jgi:hypothetical protein